jgi:hypothetical protein
MPTFRDLLTSLEGQHGLPPGLLTAVAMTESSLNPNAVSPKNTMGLFQFTEPTARQYGVEPFNPVSSAIGAAKMLGDLSRKYQGDVPSMLAGFNWGQGNVDRKGLSQAPQETRSYIDKILSAVSPIGAANAEERPAIPTRAEFLAMKRAGQIPQQTTQSPMQEEQTRIPTRAEFLQMKRLGIAPRPEETFSIAGMSVNDLPQEEQPSNDVPTREEFLAMKRAGQLPAQTENQPDEAGVLDYMKNAALGFAARGNQAMTALNPFATQEDYDRLAREQEWVRQNTGAGLGEVLADMALTAPAGGAGGLAGRALGTGALEGLTTPGGAIDKIKEAGYMALSAGLGEGAANMLGRAIHPFRAGSKEVKALVKAAEKRGIPLSAANRTGNKSLQAADAALDWMPFSAKGQAESKLAQRKAWEKAIIGEAGEWGDTASPEVMGAMKDRLSSVYDDIASRNVINMDDALRADLRQVNDKLLSRLPTNQRGIVKSYLRDFAKTGKIPAATYQETRSLLDKQARGFANSDPGTAQALMSIRDAMDKAFQRSVSPDDYAALMQANKEWGVMRTIEKATDPLTGHISPEKFMNEIGRRSKDKLIYGRGDQTLTELAKVGKEFIGKKVPDSGTAQQSFMTDMISKPWLLGGLSGYYSHEGDDPIGAALQGAGLGMLGSIIAPKVASHMLWSPNGYLSKGLIDLTEGVRSQVLSEMGRNAGIGLERVLTEKPAKKRKD